MGTAPGFGLPPGPLPSHEQLNSSTYAAFADMDASPTKTWLIETALAEPRWRPFFDRAFAQRPLEELYDLQSDPEQLQNVAYEPRYATTREQLWTRLQKALQDSGDPRVADGPVIFDQPPFTEDPDAANGKQGKQTPPKNNKRGTNR
jgi:uncharacterized sulfatase